MLFQRIQNKPQQKKLNMIQKVENKAYCYIKPTRHKHESGFKCFEVGYLIINRQNRVEDKLVLGTYSDRIQLYEDFNNNLQPNLDLTLDGYIRIYSTTWGENYWRGVS